MTTTVSESSVTINVGSNASYAIYGDDDTILIGSDDAVTAQGSALLVEVNGSGDVITIGGDGQYASDANDDVVLFQAPGTMHELAFSRVDTNATDVRITMAGDDTLGAYGSRDTVIANGTGDALWIGQNGETATGANLDRIASLDNGFVYEMFGSALAVAGAHDVIDLNGEDALRMTGLAMTVNGVGAGNVVATSGGEGFGFDDVINLADGGLVRATQAQYLEIFGDDVILRGAATESLLIGAGDTAVLSAFSDFTIGGNRMNGALDVVRAGYDFLAGADQVVASSNVKILASGVSVVAQGDDRIVLVGHSEILSDKEVGGVFAGGNHLIVDGLDNFNESDLENIAHLSTGDTMQLLANTEEAVDVTGAHGPSAVAVTLGADDLLTIGADVKVIVPVAVGTTDLGNFGADDRLALAADFSSVADLIAHTVDDGGYSVIQFDSIGDQLQIGITKTQVAAYANAGLITFA